MDSALIASQLCTVLSDLPNARQRDKNALSKLGDEFEELALNVLSSCDTYEIAGSILLRPSKKWGRKVRRKFRK
jgi:hypothetical protein